MAGGNLCGSTLAMLLHCPMSCVLMQFLTNFLMWPFMALRSDFTHKHDWELEPTPAKVGCCCA